MSDVLRLTTAHPEHTVLILEAWNIGLCDAAALTSSGLADAAASLPQDDPRMVNIRALLAHLSEGMTLLAHSLPTPKENPHG